MTTLIAFQPNNTASPPFQTNFTLDGASYSGTAWWNIAGQRWYLSLTDQSGNNIWTGALIGSPIGFDIPLAPGIFSASTLIYRADTGNFEQTP
ncbi:phage baseplate plug family protein [Dyella caseinilytica]|uniref:Uncharacterized protein n=1 Tax=Dyella caseinilytica TaxID=1849581 RepID=A0ABX7GY89_9GAMM|nr:hypothetical protein [Dyella caseinilytica]QRN55259.1 hypothetical protein ISN74_07995 [Dyella caseinilytica]GGA00508.1 hypothetical protein GCM10011408_21780 [Dyella caseinilytica]